MASPFVLDFAAAYLDSTPQMSEGTRAEREERNVERFGADWPFARILLRDLNATRFYMLDPSPGKTRFRLARLRSSECGTSLGFTAD
ncbi:MAG: hypothetical protein JO076_07370 [Verrucomicrobia bacterium]|nr:hypothetical protein [Verrucomicrobiota bacterium]